MPGSWFTSKDHFEWVAVGLLVAVVGVSGGAAYAFQGSPPTEAHLNLISRQVEVPVESPLEVTLSRPADLLSVAESLWISPDVAGQLTGSLNGLHFTFQPFRGWGDYTEYQVYLRSFTDATGHRVQPARWSFLTQFVPRVVGATAPDGTPIVDGGEADLGAPIQVAFNTPMDPERTVILLNGSPAALTWSADGRTASVPTAGMSIGPVKVTLGPGRDQQGHALARGWQLAADLVFRIHIQTTPLRFPALVQIPNDGYGARPQYGIQAADMIWEYQTEGSITRFTAIYSRVPEFVGPIRSGRLISFRLTRHYHGMLFMSGLSDGSTAALRADPVPYSYGPPGTFRSQDLAAPNNLFYPGGGIRQAEDTSGVGDFQLPTGSPQLSGGDEQSNFSVGEHDTSYAYDPATATYFKDESGQRYVDQALQQPLHIYMVIVLHTREYLVGIIESGCCTRGRDFDLDSGGGVDVFYRGRHYTGRWGAADRNSPIVFTLDSGQPVTLPSGLVWVDVVGN